MENFAITPGDGGWRALAAPAGIALLVSVALAALVLSAQPSGDQTAALYSPLLDADQALTRAAGADALILRPGGWRNVVILSAPDAATRERLYASGAWMLFDIGSVFGCLFDPGAFKRAP